MDQRVLKIENHIECRILERVNRFVVKIQLKEKHCDAYINNTGRLYEFLLNGRKAFCIKTDKRGKTDYRLFSVEESGYGAIIDTNLQMKVFEELLKMGLISWLEGCSIKKRNIRLGDSLIDYLIDCNGKEVYLEVKSAALREGNYAMYPDCPSLRGRRHIKDLIDYAKKGERTIILFIAALPCVKAFKPYKSGDEEVYDLLKRADRLGVEIRSIGIYYNPDDSFVYLFNPDLKIALTQ